MEIRGIDVSAWQGKIDWKTVADYGMGFAGDVPQSQSFSPVLSISAIHLLIL